MLRIFLASCFQAVTHNSYVKLSIFFIEGDQYRAWYIIMDCVNLNHKSRHINHTRVVHKLHSTPCMRLKKSPHCCQCIQWSSCAPTWWCCPYSISCGIAVQFALRTFSSLLIVHSKSSTTVAIYSTWQTSPGDNFRSINSPLTSEKIWTSSSSYKQVFHYSNSKVYFFSSSTSKYLYKHTKLAWKNSSLTQTLTQINGSLWLLIISHTSVDQCHNDCKFFFSSLLHDCVALGDQEHICKGKSHWKNFQGENNMRKWLIAFIILGGMAYFAMLIPLENNTDLSD